MPKWHLKLCRKGKRPHCVAIYENELFYCLYEKYSSNFYLNLSSKNNEMEFLKKLVKILALIAAALFLLGIIVSMVSVAITSLF